MKYPSWSSDTSPTFSPSAPYTSQPCWSCRAVTPPLVLSLKLIVRSLSGAHHFLHGHRRDAGHGRFGNRTLQHALPAAAPAAAAAQRSPQELTQDAGLLLLQVAGRLGQVARIL